MRRIIQCAVLAAPGGDVTNDGNRPPGVNVRSLDRGHFQNWNQIRLLVRQLGGLLHPVKANVALEDPQSLSADGVPQVRLRCVAFRCTICCRGKGRGPTPEIQELKKAACA